MGSDDIEACEAVISHLSECGECLSESALCPAGQALYDRFLLVESRLRGN